MHEIDYPRFDRLLDRCGELGSATGAHPVVARLYRERVAGPAGEFRAAHAAMAPAESAATKERSEAMEHLEGIDQPYRLARSTARAYLGDVSLPDTLKSQPTDTDKKNAIQTLQSELDSRDETDEWAAELLAGELGTRAPVTIREVEEWIRANEGLDTARKRRATAYGPAYEAYLSFKDVVREAYGSSSRQYRRIHVRRNDPVTNEPEPTGTPS